MPSTENRPAHCCQVADFSATLVKSSGIFLLGAEGICERKVAEKKQNFHKGSGNLIILFFCSQNSPVCPDLGKNFISGRLLQHLRSPKTVANCGFRKVAEFFRAGRNFWAKVAASFRQDLAAVPRPHHLLQIRSRDWLYCHLSEEKRNYCILTPQQ